MYEEYIMSNILNAFNDHFIEFLNDVQSVFPNDPDILAAKNALIMIRKANPKMIVKIWKTFIADKYRTQIEANDISFFLSKDYSSDVSNTQNSDRIMESINRLREPIKNMGPENQAKVMKYIQNLTKLCYLVE
jgi:glutamyl/glutaminyl-tRNA synthetase